MRTPRFQVVLERTGRLLPAYGFNGFVGTRQIEFGVHLRRRIPRVITEVKDYFQLFFRPVFCRKKPLEFSYGSDVVAQHAYGQIQLRFLRNSPTTNRLTCEWNGRISPHWR